MSDQGMHSETGSLRFLQRPEGKIAYDVAGYGPLVICAPGMGDLRSVYRFLAPALVNRGYRVATMDLRGHGDSDKTFRTYDDVATGEDLIALAELLGEAAVLVGNSMAAGAAAWAAAQAPSMVSALVLIGPFLRQIPIGMPARLALRLGLLRPWGPALWNAHYARLYPGRPPTDLAEHRDRMRESLRRPDAWRAFAATTRTSHAPVEAVLDKVKARALVVMGEKDPDFPDPASEARLLAQRLDGEVLMVAGAGHYPQAEYPEVVVPAVGDFLRRTVQHAKG